MAERLLAQMAVAFLLGVWGYRYQNGFMLVCWACYLGWLLSVRHKQGRQRDSQQGQGPGGRRFKKSRCVICPALCLLCLGLGFIRHHQYQALAGEVEKLLEKADVIHVSGIVDQKEEKSGTYIYHLKHSFIYQEGRRLCGRILVYHDADVYSIGDTIQVTGKKMELRKARNEGNFDEASYEYGRGVLCKVGAQEIALIRRPKILWKEGLYQIRKQMAQVYMRHLPEKTAGVISVMALGEKARLDPQIKEMYQETGVSHVLAISGLHISLLGMGLYRFLRKRGVSYGTSGGIAGAAVICFGQISGMGLSARRAVLMFLVLLLGNVLGMAYDSVTALSVAAVLQIWEYPKSLWQAGFLFSYGAVLAVVAAAPVIKGFWVCQKTSVEQNLEADGSGQGAELQKTAKLCRKSTKGSLLARKRRDFLDMLFVSGCIQLMMLPLTAYVFYEVPLYGILTNILLLPLMGLLLVMGLLGGILGLVNDDLAYICLKAVQLLLGWNTWVCEGIKRLPGAVWITGKPDDAHIAGCYVFFVFMLCLMKRQTKKKEELRREVSRQPRKKRYALRSVWGKLFLCGMPAAACFLLLATAGMKRSMQVCFLDMGQGDGVFFQGDGASFFLDGGSTSESRAGRYRILPFLKYRGIDSVDGWFVSHADQDHISGLQELWEEGYHIKRLFLAEGMVRDEAWQELCRQAGKHKTSICYLKPGDTVGTASFKLTCLYPWEKGSDRNEASMVLKLDVLEKGKRKLEGLFAGDIGQEQEKLLLERYPDLTVNLYKASHHGSDGSNSREFIGQLSPQITVVSCGERNNYGHPGKDAVERILSCGSRIWYTKDSGQITVEYRNGSLCVKAFLQE